MDELDNGTFLVDIIINSGNQIVVEIDNMTNGVAKEQYTKNIGREVKVVYTDHGSLEGVLKAVDEEKIVIETSKKQKIEGKKKKEVVVETTEIPFDKIKETKIIISFKQN